jgi:peptidoglycan pentaglycine glycine transferase (the first glycine)
MDIRVIEGAGRDPAWDAFLATQPAGQHLQSSPWGELKARFGWQVTRVLAREGSEICGGAQILMRRLPVWGSVGYISKGPVVASGRNDAMDALCDAVEHVAERKRILILSIQPPEDTPLCMQPLKARNFQPSSFYVVPATTVLVDLEQNEDEILASMRKSTRYSVRRASREGVTVREGDASHLPLFYKWVTADAAQDPSYVHYSLEYYQEAWRLFASRGMMKLLVAYYEDEPLGINIVIYLGNWGVYKWGSSSGAHHRKLPNYLLQWEAIRWCKSRGCRYYDLGGITPSVSETLELGEKLEPTASKGAGIAYFKSGFGEIVTFPDSYDNNYGFRPRWLIRTAVRYAWRFNVTRKLARGV